MLGSSRWVVAALMGALFVLTASATAEMRMYMSFGVMVDVPEGWHRYVENSPMQVGNWVVIEDAEPALSVQLAVQPANDKPASHYAQRWAQKVGGRVEESSVKLGRAPTLVVVPAEAARPDGFRRMLVARHDERIITLGHFAADARFDDTVNQFAESLEVFAPQEPTIELSAVEHAPSLFGTGFMLPMAEPFRRQAPDTANVQVYEALDFANQKLEAMIMLKHIAKDPAKSVEQIAEDMGQALRVQAGREKPIQFLEARDEPRVLVSEPWEPQDGTSELAQTFMMSPKPDELIVGVLTVRVDDAEAARLYARAFTRMAQGIYHSEAYLDARREATEKSKSKKAGKDGAEK